MRARSFRSEIRTSGRRPRLIPAARRLVAILVLYALALQSVLSGLAMAAAAGPEHVLCVAGGTIDKSRPDHPFGPAHGPMACCVACHAAGPAALPAPAPAEGMAFPGTVALVRTRPARITLPRAPPGTGHRARAPPPVV